MGWAKTLVLLFRHKADPLVRNVAGQTALEVAKTSKYPKVKAPTERKIWSARSVKTRLIAFGVSSFQVIKVLEEARDIGVDAIVTKYREEL